jgi:hypothetical protein
MSGIESQVFNSDKLTRIFGSWPSFRDAVLLEVRFVHADLDPVLLYSPLLLTLKLRVWRIAQPIDLDSRGYPITECHTLATFRFHDVAGLKLTNLDQQYAVAGMSISRHERTDGPSPYFAVEFEQFGRVDASFTFICSRVEVVDALACDSDGRPLPPV